MAVYQTAVQYHFWHALGLLAVGILLLQKPDSGALAAAAWLLVAGLVAVLRAASTCSRSPACADWGAVTPVGGVAFLAGVGALGLGGVAVVTRLDRRRFNRPSRPTP